MVFLSTVERGLVSHNRGQCLSLSGGALSLLETAVHGGLVIRGLLRREGGGVFLELSRRLERKLAKLSDDPILLHAYRKVNGIVQDHNRPFSLDLGRKHQNWLLDILNFEIEGALGHGDVRILLDVRLHLLDGLLNALKGIALVQESI